MAQTLDTKCEQGIGIGIYDAYNKQWRKDNMCGTLTANSMTSTTHAGTFEVAQIADMKCEQRVVDTIHYPKGDCQIAIRKLTPKECFRLQAVPDELFERAKFVNSDAQLYKQAGNAVTATVVYALAKKLTKGQK